MTSSNMQLRNNSEEMQRVWLNWLKTNQSLRRLFMIRMKISLREYMGKKKKTWLHFMKRRMHQKIMNLNHMSNKLLISKRNSVTMWIRKKPKEKMR